MPVLTVTSKGQVTLRRELLQHLGVEPGDRISIEKLPDGRLEARAVRVGAPIATLAGRLKRDGQRSLTLEDIETLASEGWAGET